MFSSVRFIYVYDSVIFIITKALAAFLPLLDIEEQKFLPTVHERKAINSGGSIMRPPRDCSMILRLAGFHIREDLEFLVNSPHYLHRRTFSFSRY